MIRKILLVVFMICGCATGYYFGYRAGLENGGMEAAGAEYAKYTRLLVDQFRHGSCEAVRKALVEYDAKLEALFGKERIYTVDSNYFAEKTLINTRLYLLETKAGNQGIAGNYLSKAREFCMQYRDRECSTESLLELLEQVDEENPIVCLQQSPTTKKE